jgi:NAD-dependent protein deacetylase/lipoamidase
VIPRAARRAWWLALVTAVGYGQILFCESAAAGAALALGIATVAPRAALMGVLACALATVMARHGRYPTADWRRGLYGYAAALTGTFWGLLFDGGFLSWLLLLIAAAAGPPATRLAHRLLTPRGVPALAAPALVLVWAALPLLRLAPPSEDAAPSVIAQALAWTLTLAGLAVYSRLTAMAAVVGALAGIVASLAMTGGLHGVIVSNAMPTAVALTGVFLPWSPAAVVVGAVAAAAAGALAWLGVLTVGAWGVPVLVAPFNVVTVLVIAALRLPAVRRRVPGRPAPLPLASVGPPEAGRALWAQQRRLAALVARAKRVCVLTGAGVSTAAGLPDFRGPQGLWARQGRITLDTFIAAAEARERYWKEEEAFFRLVAHARPAAVHHALVALHAEGRLASVVTQNVDGLHQAAGLPDDKVIEIHGSLRDAACVDCGWTVPRASLSEAIAAGAATFYCERCRGLVKGGSVMFGERLSPAVLQASLCALLASDLLLVLGTSLAVTPASDLVRWARDAGIPVAIVNATPTRYDDQADVTVNADVGVTMEVLGVRL